MVLADHDAWHEALIRQEKVREVFERSQQERDDLGTEQKAMQHLVIVHRAAKPIFRTLKTE